MDKELMSLVDEIKNGYQKVSQSRIENQKKGKHGLVRVDRIAHHYSNEPNKKHPSHEGFLNINVCSTTDKIEFKGLSPFLLGKVYHDDPFFPPCETFENYWWWCKVYTQDVDKNDNPTNSFLDRRKKWFLNSKSKKRDRKRDDFLYVYHNNKRYSYLDARKEVYCKIYSDLAVKTNSYKKLNQKLDEGTNIQLLGYDGIDYHPEEDSDGSILYQHLMNPDRSFGHEMVLVGLLTNKKVWD